MIAGFIVAGVFIVGAIVCLALGCETDEPKCTCTTAGDLGFNETDGFHPDTVAYYDPLCPIHADS